MTVSQSVDSDTDSVNVITVTELCKCFDMCLTVSHTVQSGIYTAALCHKSHSCTVVL